MTIVLADDDDELRAVIAARLRAEGHQVWEARDGRQTIDLARSRQPALLILDLWMPELDGLQVLDALRHDPAAGRMKVLMLSACSEADARLASFGSGAVEYLVKGGSLDPLIAAVNQAAALSIATPFFEDEDSTATEESDPATRSSPSPASMAEPEQHR